MSQISHDQNFKNLFIDFPEDALKWLLPQVLQAYGDVRNIEFIRQESKKHRLNDSYRALDLPILFTFEHLQIILWLVEFQEDKHKFSVYKLLHYVTDMMEAHPKAVVVPTVLFTDRRKWREDVDLKLKSELCGETFLQFKYLKIKLYNYHARDYYHSDNPLIKILLPKMKYMPDERTEVIIQAYKGLFQLATPMLFDKYVDFIDIYAEVLEEEREHIVSELNTKKETVMLAQYIKDKGIQEGIEKGIPQGVLLGETNLLCTQISEKYSIPDDKLMPILENLNSEMLLELGKRILYWDSYDKVQDWIRQQTQNAK
ncbi:hypothetical protein QUF90_22945 [Desulfococcaceae bacterium HSG9]|nr:hypothetical protein [Desulfococcaceae bacterium HSG9]